MKTRHLIICFLVPVLGLVSGCGPSPEELAATAAAQTAAAATSTPTPTYTPTPTSTPTPTPTPTPIPYDLALSITGEGGAPVSGAAIILAELNEEQTTGDDGQVAWSDLPGEAVTLTVSAQGYFTAEISEIIGRGPNEVGVTLERDPFGLLPGEACAPGETLVYIDDFQDGTAEGWPEIEINALGYSVEADPDEPENTVITISGPYEGQNSVREDFPERLSWRLRFRIDGVGFLYTVISLTIVDGSWENLYEIAPGTLGGANRSGLHRIEEGRYAPVRFWADPSEGDWHSLEFGRFEDTIEVWMDGKQVALYQDPRPLPTTGAAILGVTGKEDTAIVYVDDMSVCELSAPFEPLPTPTVTSTPES